MTTYLALAIADSMFQTGTYAKRTLSIDEVRSVLADGVVSCVNPAHASTIRVLESRFGFTIPIPEQAVKITLEQTDRLLVCTILGLPRETREFTDDEVVQATIVFSLWERAKPSVSA